MTTLVTKRPGISLVLAVALLSAALTGCGGGGSVSVASAAEAAKAIGCDTSTPNDTEEMFVTDAADCTIDGADVTVYYFSTTDARDSYIKVAGQFGGQYLVKDRWVVDAKPDVLASLQSSAGGEIRP